MANWFSFPHPIGLKKDFDQWDSLVDGIGPNVIPGTNIDTSPAESE